VGRWGPRRAEQRGEGRKCPHDRKKKKGILNIMSLKRWRGGENFAKGANKNSRGLVREERKGR